MTDASTHIIRVAFQDGPSIYREIEIESRKTLHDLAKAIVHAFGFDFDHAFGFYSKLTGRDVMRSTAEVRVVRRPGGGGECEEREEDPCGRGIPGRRAPDAVPLRLW